MDTFKLGRGVEGLLYLEEGFVPLELIVALGK